MSQRPKPTALHRLHGTGNATRMKARRNEPVPPEGDLRTPPDHLSESQKADWVFAIDNAPAGVIFACDRGLLEVYIVARDHHRLANRFQGQLDSENEAKLLVQTPIMRNSKGAPTSGGNLVPSPYLRILAKAGTLMVRAAAELGFTPAARPRLGADVFDPSMMLSRSTREGSERIREPSGADLDVLIARRARIN
jgi:phage terminase small subunit